MYIYAKERRTVDAQMIIKAHQRNNPWGLGWDSVGDSCRGKWRGCASLGKEVLVVVGYQLRLVAPGPYPIGAGFAFGSSRGCAFS